MGRILLGLLACLLVISSLPARANTLEPPLYDLLLRPEFPFRGTTTKKYPSLCWVLGNRPPVGATIMFTLMDSRSTKPVLEVQLATTIPIEKQEPCYCVNLKDYDISLEPHIMYRWDISIAQNPESHSRDVVVGGEIERCAEEDCQIGDMPLQCDRDSVRRLVIRGFWYDSISCLCDLVKCSPDDKTLRRMLDHLMKQVGSVQTEPRYTSFMSSSQKQLFVVCLPDELKAFQHKELNFPF